ncbi:UNKNOWN [Stylonychia lemnae]|uniref:Uncharacterized protein n=1 Tax=Stylonychia lemnae TaxID=5949 RepID=A0A078ARD4_STYLE|nr:UNKNOWN [Stylonychia lemnae]|eukprot:CDW84779.1 UNKNOWN [Stylonychia lemnae]
MTIFDKAFLIYNAKHRYNRFLMIDTLGTPNVVKINKNLFLIWYRKVSKIQIFNINTLTVEQTIFLPKNQIINQFQKVSNCKTYKNELCLRDFKDICFYELRVYEYPFLFLKHKIHVLNIGNLILNTQINRNYVCNYYHDFDRKKTMVHVSNRVDLQQIDLEFESKDQVFMVNQLQNEDKVPVFLRLSDDKLSLVILNEANQKAVKVLDLNNFNSLNTQILAANSITSVYTKTYRSKFIVFIIRKLPDNQGFLWRIEIGRKFIKNLILENQV